MNYIKKYLYYSLALYVLEKFVNQFKLHIKLICYLITRHFASKTESEEKVIKQILNIGGGRNAGLKG